MIEILGDDWLYRVMGIDNGSNTVGGVIIDHHLQTNVSTVMFARTVTADRSAYERFSGRRASRGNLEARLEVIDEFMYDMLDEWNPHAVGVESPFMHLHAQSFAVLTSCMKVIDDRVYRFNPTIEFAKVPPGRAKKAVCPIGKYRNDKDLIRQFILDDPLIVAGEGVDLEALDEHSIDGITVARCLALDASARAFV